MHNNSHEGSREKSSRYYLEPQNKTFIYDTYTITTRGDFQKDILFSQRIFQTLHIDKKAIVIVKFLCIEAAQVQLCRRERQVFFVQHLRGMSFKKHGQEEISTGCSLFYLPNFFGMCWTNEKELLKIYSHAPPNYLLRKKNFVKTF